jgi:hypothetical protein
MIAANGDLWTSDNSGQTWVDQTAGNDAGLSAAHFDGVAIDSSGNNMVAVSQAGEGTQPGIWTSTNAGVTWTNVTPAAGASNSWFNVVSDSTGQNLAVTGGADQSGVYDVWTSNNGGASWTNRTTGTNVGGQVWLGLASDSTGMKLVGGVGDYLYMSSNGGASWTQQSIGSDGLFEASQISSSSDGSHIIATGLVGVVYTTNGGDSWTALPSSIVGGYVAVNPAGTHFMIAAAQDVSSAANQILVW